MKYLTFLITLPLTAFCAYIILANEASAAISYLPGLDAYGSTLGIISVAMLGIGFFSGALFVWLHAQKAVFRGWQEKKRADRLEKELDQMHKKAEVTTQDVRPSVRKFAALSFLQGK